MYSYSINLFQNYVILRWLTFLKLTGLHNQYNKSMRFLSNRTKGLYD